MAKQLNATVINNNGGTYPLSFPTDNIWIREDGAEAVINAYVGSPIPQPISYNVSETLSELLTLANTSGTSMIQATVIQVGGLGTVDYQALFPTNNILIGEDLGVTYIQFKNIRYSVSETQDELVTAANAGGGGGDLGYDVYTALLSQSGTVAPTATVAGTTTLSGGNIVWSRLSLSNYVGTSIGSFSGLLVAVPNKFGYIDGDSVPGFIVIQAVNDDIISLQSLDMEGNPKELLVELLPVEIRNY